MKSSLFLRISPLVAALALAGCVSYSGITPHSTAASNTDLSLSSATIQWPSEQWWNVYNDAVLSDLITQALAKNPSIKLAQARLERVAAMAQAVDAGTLPEVGVGLSMTPEHFTENGLYPPPFAGNIYSTNLLMVNAKYEFDFWGKNRAALDSALSTEKAAKAELQSAHLLIAASVAKSYFSLAHFSEQKKVLEMTLAQREELLNVSQQRLAAGLDTQQELHISKEGLPAIRAEIIKLDEQISLSRNALAALIGKGPEATLQVVASFPTDINMNMPDSIPANLIGRRADISAARARVDAANKQIAVAKTEFYPNINLTAFAGFSSLGFSHWLDGSSRDYGVGPAISLPIFDGGRLRANLSSKDAEYDIALESYNQTLIEAVHDIADQISSLRSLAQQQKQQAELQHNAESVYELAQQREKAGLVSKVTVLNAQTAVLTQQSAAIDLKARALDLTVNLNRALGGGFNDQTTASTF
ncbi:efflux transporter outer membrane subunit [Solimicrobium silvestre]|uniref:Efflux transporter, outer membrane factor (OMF) lipoprotein, NodT family n=1 Tax=Solimicrobium silvestre TaxID=2099400 RepID=A0A2S9GUA1_9BURK|nr:efflux transporter outer membrane subunit [Solimicrobium silvestre]PRC91283.1 Efflux transporter, outer membrane factor (OMF) lipoprotein, NodT family [Solimicrobium silvestre]